MVVFGQPDCRNSRTNTITNPVAIVEVLSKSTKNYARVYKFGLYKIIATFREYITIDRTRIHIDRHSKTENKTWLYSE